MGHMDLVGRSVVRGVSFVHGRDSRFTYNLILTIHLQHCHVIRLTPH